MTRAELNEIKQTIKQAQVEVALQMEEVWLSKEDFLRQFGMFTEDWLKKYGQLLGRTQAIVTDGNSEHRISRWAYPRNKVQQMIMDGSIKRLKCYKVKIIDSKDRYSPVEELIEWKGGRAGKA